MSGSIGNIAIYCSSNATASIIASSRHLVLLLCSLFEPKVLLDLLCQIFRLLDDSIQSFNELGIVFGYTKVSQGNVVPMRNGLEGPIAQSIDFPSNV